VIRNYQAHGIGVSSADRNKRSSLWDDYAKKISLFYTNENIDWKVDMIYQ
jgi:hypothetical protein